MRSLSLWAAACLLLFWCSGCSLNLVVAAESASARWHDLVKSAAPVATTDETVFKAALVRRPSHTQPTPTAPFIPSTACALLTCVLSLVSTRSSE
jgi:hypothetical protein